MSDKIVLIIGGGQAGFELATALREYGFAGRVRIVGEEPCVPYRRPPLSKEFLGGGVDINDIGLATSAELQDTDIELNTACRAVSIDRALRRVYVADGRSFPYDILVLATGARSRNLSAAGSAGPLYLRGVEDAATLKARIREAGSLIVVGAGFLGLEIASFATELGLTVDVVESASGPMARTVSFVTSAALRSRHESRGVRFHFNAAVSKVREAERGRQAVRLQDGTELTADLLVVSVGAEPNVGLASASGLPVANGIVVDEHLRTIDPAIFAVGDCAAFPSQHLGNATRLESVQNAVDQGRHVAREIVDGVDLPFCALPWFWSDQAGCRLQIAGLTSGHDEVEALADTSSSGFSVLCFGAGRLIGVETIDRPKHHMIARRLLQKGEVIIKERARILFGEGTA